MLPQNNDKEKKVNDFKKDRIDGKLRWELLPLDLIEDLVRVYNEGAKKYFVGSWKQIDDGKNRCKGALLRHLLESEKQDLDDETGCYHLAQVAWNALTMLWYRKQELKKETSNIDEFAKYSKETFGDLNHMNTGAVRVVGKDEEITPCAILKPVYIKDNSKNNESLNTVVNTTINKLNKADGTSRPTYVYYHTYKNPNNNCEQITMEINSTLDGEKAIEYAEKEYVKGNPAYSRKEINEEK